MQICVGNHDSEDTEILLIYIVPMTLNYIFTLLVDLMTYVKKELNSKTPLTTEYCLSDGTMHCSISEMSHMVNDFCILMRKVQIIRIFVRIIEEL